MRVLVIPSWYPTPAKPINGVFVQQQADALHRSHDVRVLYLDVLPRRYKGLPRRRISRQRGYIEEIVEVPNHPLVWQFTYLWYLVRAFRNVRREFPPDVVHCHVAVPAGWGGALLRRLFGVPVVLTEHSSEFASWARRAGLRFMAAIAFRSADVTIAVGEGQRRRLVGSFPQTRRTTVIHNIVDTSRFMPSPFPAANEGFRLLFVGLMDTDQKGVHLLLEAIAQICEQGRLGVHLDLVGDGGLRAKYEAQAQRLGLNDVVTFHGLQPHRAVAQMLQAAHALVLPSLHEALPLVIIEALASGRPVVSTRCGGPEFMINESCGRIVDPGNANQLAGAIVNVLVNLHRYNPYHIAAVASGQYGYASVTKALTLLFEELRAS